ncbi:uncharacterized protein LOC109719390 isoform X1 [Ananas comosus]|uniref:Uncharacterized protein LOC109719390 isoform X1 n=1 Tax=Ananas comosus TaxID=4615 RepID=A0A6P5FZV5_ANACO|nr:uncharacterized protein LOC109719390 isoform X1 [Ananas comosus]
MAAKNGPTDIEKEQVFGMAEKEMEYRVDLFNSAGCNVLEEVFNFKRGWGLQRSVSINVLIKGDQSNWAIAWLQSATAVKSLLQRHSRLLPSLLNNWRF